jgi:hypothetical protein
VLAWAARALVEAARREAAVPVPEH